LTAAPSQLVLRFPLVPAVGVPDLLPNTAQDDARAWLDAAQPWPLGRLALWGKAGSGKSHLAQVWANRVGGAVVSTAPTDGWPRHPVAIDAIDTVPDEPALLFLLNAAAEAKQPVLLVSRIAPGRLPVRLPDLASRLRATTAVRIGPADDSFLAMLLARFLADRQLRLPGALQAWLLMRLPRTPAAVRDAVDRLDAAALSSGRPITRPMAAEVLGLYDNSAEVASSTSPQPQDVG
jgi:chromosomal replication initiation ATPase DnaA